MTTKLGEFTIGMTRLSLYQDRETGKIYHRTIRGSKELVTPLQNGKVIACGQVAITITPPLPADALEIYRKKRTAPK